MVFKKVVCNLYRRKVYLVTSSKIIDGQWMSGSGIPFWPQSSIGHLLLMTRVIRAILLPLFCGCFASFIPMFLYSRARIYDPCYMKGFLRKLIIRQNSDRLLIAARAAVVGLFNSLQEQWGIFSSFSLITTAQIYVMICCS